jgi:hypothetical protein
MVKINKSGKLNNTIQYKQNKQHKQIIYNISAKLLIKIYEPLTEKYTIWMKYTDSPTWHNSWWSIKNTTAARPPAIQSGAKLPLCCYSLPNSRDVRLSTLIRQIGLCIGTKTDLRTSTTASMFSPANPFCVAKERPIYQPFTSNGNQGNSQQILIIQYVPRN